MTDPRKAKSLGEAALNPDGTYNGTLPSAHFLCWHHSPYTANPL